MLKKPKKNQKDEGVKTTRHQRRMRYLKTRRNMRQFEINIYRIRAFVRFIAILGLMWCIYKVANLPQWYLSRDVLKTYPSSSLELEGNDIITTKQIMAQMQNITLPHKPIYLVDTRQLEKSLYKLSPVKKVYIRRFAFPARLKVVITEKKPIFSVSPSLSSKPTAVFTDDSGIIGSNFLPLPATDVVYSIITFDDFYSWKPQYIKYIYRLSQLIEHTSNEKLVYLDIRNKNDVYAQLSSVKLRLGDLNRSIFARSERITSVLSEALKIKDKIDYIDLRWNASIVIKLKKENLKKPNPPSSKIQEMEVPEN